MSEMVANAQEVVRLLTNAYLGRDMRSPLLDGAFGTRDIDLECGYPIAIQTIDYVRMYERNDIAARVVDIEPLECWKEYPNIYETEEERETPFEQAVDKLVSSTDLYSYLLRADRVSGIGRYGVLFLGFDDGEDFSEPAPGFSESAPLKKPGKSQVLYYRVMDESAATVFEFEKDATNPRYGLPKYYTLEFMDYVGSAGSPAINATALSAKVHWSRVIHVTDNLTNSEVYGQPRMQNVYNRLYDLRKICGGAAEMFWKGGFPGYSFEVDPKAGEFTADEKSALKEETKAYSEGLQRYLTTIGVSVKSLSPQVADPSNHIMNCLRIISITKGIPFPILVGNETGQIAGTSQAALWAERVAFRRNMTVTPRIIRPTIDRLIQAGALPQPLESQKNLKNYTVKWTPLATLTEVERAQVGKDLTEALARYSTAGAEALVPLPEFLSKFLGFSFQQTEAIMKAPPTELSVVLQELAMGLAGGNTGAAGGNMPTSIPNMAKTKDPGKTPQNAVQRKKGTKIRSRSESATVPAAVTANAADQTHAITNAITAIASRPVNVKLTQDPIHVSVESQSPIVNVTHPDITVKVPRQRQRRTQVDVHVPQQTPPNIQVNVPAGPAPVVTVAAPQVDVHVPQQVAPDVNITVNPEIKLPEIPHVGAKIIRDSDGKITRIEPNP